MSTAMMKAAADLQERALEDARRSTSPVLLRDLIAMLDGTTDEVAAQLKAERAAREALEVRLSAAEVGLSMALRKLQAHGHDFD